MHVETSFVRNLGGLMSPAAALAVPGQSGKLEKRSPAGRHEELDGCIVPRNLEQSRVTSAAEMVEGRRPVEGRARYDACPGHRAGIGMSPQSRVHGSVL